MVKDGGKGTVPRKAALWKKVVRVGAGLALGALAGIVVGSAVGVGIAMILGIL